MRKEYSELEIKNAIREAFEDRDMSNDLRFSEDKDGAYVTEMLQTIIRGIEKQPDLVKEEFERLLHIHSKSMIYDNSCPYCGEYIDEDNRICPNCGESLERFLGDYEE